MANVAARWSSAGLVCAALSVSTSFAAAQGVRPAAAASRSCPVTWLKKGQFGVSTHYFPRRPDEIARVANNIDVTALAARAADIGASWVLFTLQQENWLLMAPNQTFARIVGSDQFMSRRDVPMELIGELKKRGIKPILYLNLRMDPTRGVNRQLATAMGGWPPTEQLIKNISAVYREYAVRYGSDVAGWWIDGAGIPEFGSSPSREGWFRTISDALRAGNPDAMIAFSPGLHIGRYSQFSNYTAGESNDLVQLPADGGCIDGVQWHEWTYLGGWWGADGTRFADPQLCRYAVAVVSRGGSLTFDIGTWGERRDGMNGPRTNVRAGGVADAAQVKQLTWLHERLTKAQGNSNVCD